MDTKRFLIGTIVGGIVLFVAGYVIYELILGNVMEANSPHIPGVDREVPQYAILAVGCLAYAALICYAMGRGGATGLATGAKVGAVVGVLLWATADLTIHAFTNLMTPAGIAMDMVGSLLMGAIGGAAIGLVASKVKPAAA